MECADGMRKTRQTHSMSVLILQELCTYMIAALDTSQVLMITKLELVNSKIAEAHIAHNLLDFKFLYINEKAHNHPMTSTLLSPTTHQALTIFNIALPTTLILLGVFLTFVSYRAGKNANNVSLNKHGDNLGPYLGEP